MRNLFVIISGLFLLSACNKQASYKLVWSDEFEKSGLPDSSKWSYDTKGNAYGWGNHELQFYTENRAENAKVLDGKLIITARKDSGYMKPYTSARLTSKGKGDWLYGRIEVRARIPSGLGVWPAIWMLPTESVYGGWPRSGEIDIMEHVGYLPDSVFFTVHTEAYNHRIGTQRSKSVYNTDVESNFHVYAIEWTANAIEFFLDEELVFVFSKEADEAARWPFDKPFHMILNLAFGGDWGGAKGIDDSILPQVLAIDYVRVYQKNEE